MTETEVDVSEQNWIIAKWPDDFWCNWEERFEYTHRSDDYEKLRVITYIPAIFNIGKTEKVTE